MTKHENYEQWAAAYVLGSLPPGERREFEQHLNGCEACTEQVAEFAGLPGLLAKVEPGEAIALLEQSPEEASDFRPPADLIARIEEARSRRRRRRTVATVLTAAAVGAAALAVSVPLVTSALGETASVDLQLQAAAAGGIVAFVELHPENWGTSIDMRCEYESDEQDDEGYYPAGPVRYALWVVDRAGGESPVATWQAGGGDHVELTASTRVDLQQIAAVEVRAEDSGEVLLRDELTP